MSDDVLVNMDNRPPGGVRWNLCNVRFPGFAPRRFFSRRVQMSTNKKCEWRFEIIFPAKKTIKSDTESKSSSKIRHAPKYLLRKKELKAVVLFIASQKLGKRACSNFQMTITLLGSFSCLFCEPLSTSPQSTSFEFCRPRKNEQRKRSSKKSIEAFPENTPVTRIIFDGVFLGCLILLANDPFPLLIISSFRAQTN